MSRTYIVIIVFAINLIAVAARAADPLPDDLTSQRLTVHFDNKTTPAGTLKFKDQTYPFSAEFKDNKLVGTFKVGNDSYPFTLTQDGKTFTFETQGTQYPLTAVVRNPLGADVPVKPAAPPAITLEPQTMTDPASKLEVATLLVPKGWTLKSDVLWRPTMAQFVCLTTAVFDPKTGWGLRWLPMDRFNACPAIFNEARKQNNHPMSGGLELCDAVLSPADYIQQVVVPRYRKIAGVKVVDAQDLKELTQKIEEAKADERNNARQNGYEMQYPAARVRIEYPGPGDSVFQEDIYCVLAVTWNPQANANVRNAGFPGTQSFLFYPDRLYSFTAPKGQLEAASPLLQTILSSTRGTLKWDAYIGNINQMMQRAAIDDHMMEVASRAEITKIQQESFEARQKSQDKIAEQVGHLIRGTQAFNNPNPNKPPIVVPAGTKAWIDPTGKVIYSADTQYNPATAPDNTSTWTQLKNDP